MTASEEVFLSWVDRHGDGLAQPGSGGTWSRFEALADVCAADLSAGRLAEGHADAIAILHELGSRPRTRKAYGVWAARPSELKARPAGGGWVLDGVKPFCSGAGFLRRALVVATAPDGPRMFDLDVGAPEVEAGTWPAVGMAGSQSGAVRWSGQVVPADLAVGEPGSYTSRVGFWWGATGVAACWWGGARALVETTRTWMGGGAGESQFAALGRAWARLVAMERVLRQAAASIDGTGCPAAARHEALVAREVVHDGCQAVLREVAAAAGAGPICLDPAQSRRAADLYAYLAQYHPGRDQAELGRMLVAE